MSELRVYETNELIETGTRSELYRKAQRLLRRDPALRVLLFTKCNHGDEVAA